MDAFIIQLSTRNRSEVARLIETLIDRGVEIDHDYGVVPVDINQHVHVVRGLVPSETVPTILQDERVLLFRDIRIDPA